MKLILLLLALMLTFPQDTLAYIDPGTVGVVVGGAGATIWAVIAGGFTTIVALTIKYFKVIKSKWQKLRKKGN